jgi:diketogulonate reductase-like aldo/keto reductase
VTAIQTEYSLMQRDPEKNGVRPIVDLLRRFAEKKNATPAQLALAWLLAQKPWIVPIPGTRNIDHLTENLGAINVELRPADLREIETAFAPIKAHGGRMNEEQMKVVDQTSDAVEEISGAGKRS